MLIEDCFTQNPSSDLSNPQPSPPFLIMQNLFAGSGSLPLVIRNRQLASAAASLFLNCKQPVIPRAISSAPMSSSNPRSSRIRCPPRLTFRLRQVGTQSSRQETSLPRTAALWGRPVWQCL
jgi:hypothetical protein